MNSFKKGFLYGMAVWLVPFVTAMIIFPIHESNRILFESIMPVSIAFGTVLFAYLYFRSVEDSYVKEGMLLGTTWFAISIVIDLFMFLPADSPMYMPLSEYMADIGITYLIIPAVTVGFGYILEKQAKG